MKKFLIFLLIVAAVCYWSINYVKTGKFQNYIDSNSKSAWAPKVQFDLGMVYYIILSDYKNAEYSFKHLMENYPKSSYRAESLFQLGNLYEDTERRPEAKQVYKQLLDEYPNYRKFAIVRKKIDYLNF